jgi:hypothetical protein
MTSEEIFLGLLVLFSVLFTAITLWLRTFTEPKVPPPPEPKPSPAALRIPRVSPPGQPRSSRHDVLPGATLKAAEPAATRQPARAWVGDLQDVRRGMILMAILGPCRGLERPGQPPSVPPNSG